MLEMSEYLVTRLQGLADTSGLRPNEGSPPWLVELAENALNDGGTLALLGPNGVGVRTVDGQKTRVTPDQVGVLLTGLAGRVRRTRERIAVGIPPAARHLPLLLASSTVLADTLASAIEPSSESPKGALIISPDLDLRSRYCDLFVGDFLLDDAKPGTRMKPNGERILLRARKDRVQDGGVCFFLPQLDLPTIQGYSPGLIVLDLRYAKWVRRARTLAEWTAHLGTESGVIALYSAGDRMTLTDLTNAGFADLPLDHVALNTCATALQSRPMLDTERLDWHLADSRKFLNREHEVRNLGKSEVLDEEFLSIRVLLEEYRDTDNLDLHRARWLFAVLTQIPVPLDWYERTARNSGRSSLRRLIERLGTLDQDRNVPGAVIGTLRMAFERVYQHLSSCNPRAVALRDLLPTLALMEPEERVMVLVRDRVMERALRSWLMLDVFSRSDWLGAVDILAFTDYSKVAEHKYAAAVLNGPLPRRYRWALSGALASSVIFLAYQHEWATITRQLSGVYGGSSYEARALKRAETVCKGSEGEGLVLQINPPKLKLILPPEHVRDSDGPEQTSPDTRVLSMDDYAPSAMLHLDDQQQQDSELAWDDDLDDDASDALEAVDVEDVPIDERLESVRALVESRLHGAGTMWLPTEELLEVIRPETGDEILLLHASDLRSGDVLICVDSGGRSDLFDQMLELAADQPEMRYLRILRRHWTDAMQQLAENFLENGRVNYASMLRALQRNGAKITSPLTIRLWVMGRSIGPEDRTSIVAVGKTVRSEALTQNAREMDRAFRRIRGIHQGIGRKLSGLIHRSFRQLAGATEDDSVINLDDRLALPLNELVETVDLARVVEVAGETALVPPQWGRRWQPNNGSPE